MSIENMNTVMARMQAMAEMAQGRPVSNDPRMPVGGTGVSTQGGTGVDFGAVLKEAVQQVSDAQNAAQSKAQAFQLGAKDMSLEEVMVSLQKANLAFQGMIAVRNKLVEAYRDVTNLQV
jgi:flagellar hook-basal body complex protein FliE